jgi:nicotinic acid mononucleotide adenylyltransferase
MIVKMANVKNITYEFIDSFVKYGKKRNLMETLLSIEKPKWDEMKEIVKKIKINICDVSYDDIDIWKIYKRIDKLKNIILSRST